MGSIRAAKDQSGKWAVTNLPKLAGVGEQTNYSNNGGSSWAVNADSKKKDLAVEFPCQRHLQEAQSFYDQLFFQAVHWLHGYLQAVQKLMQKR